MSESEDADVKLLQVPTRRSPEAGTPPRIADDLDVNRCVGCSRMATANSRCLSTIVMQERGGCVSEIQAGRPHTR